MQQNLRVLRDHGQQILLRIPLRNLYLPLQNAHTRTHTKTQAYVNYWSQSRKDAKEKREQEKPERRPVCRIEAEKESHADPRRFP